MSTGKRRSGRTIRVLWVAAAVAAMGPAARGAISWTGASGTSWGTGTSWSNGSGPGTTDTASFTDTGSSNVPNDLTSALNADRTIGGLTFNDTANHYHTLDLGGHTLTVNGNLNFNTDQGSTTTTTIRDGALVLGGSFASINVGRSVSSNATAIVDFSGLTSLNAMLQALQVGASTAGTANGTLTLSPSNTISAGVVYVGASFNSGDTNGTLHLGLNTTILTPEFDIAKDNSNARVDIVNGAAFTLGSAAQPTLLQVASQNFNNQYNSYTGQLILGNAAVNLTLSSMAVAVKNGGSGGTVGVVQGGGSGSVAIGSPAARGNVYVGYAPNGGTAQGSVDLSRLGTFTAYVNDFFLGVAPTGSASGTMSLPAISTIDAVNGIIVGNNGTGTLTLGRTSNILMTNQLVVGQDNSNSVVVIPSGGSLTLGSAAQRTSVSVGAGNFNNSYVGYLSKLDLTGGTFNAYLSQLIVGQKDGGAGSSTGTLLAGNGGSIDLGGPGNMANFYVGNTVNGGSSTGTADLSGLNSFNANLNALLVGTATSGTAHGTLKLAASNVIIANRIIVGDTVGGSNTVTNTMVLGMNNTILTTQWNIGQDYTNGLVQIPAGGSLTLGSASQRASISIATGSVSDPYNAYFGTLDLTSATFVGYLGSVILGNDLVQSSAEIANFTISTNKNNYIDANSIAIGGNQSTGTLTYGGGVFYVGAITGGVGTANFNWTGGRLSVGSFGSPARGFDLKNTGTGVLAPGTANGAIGTTNIYGSYTQGAAAGMAIRIAGVAPGTGNDLVAVSASASLAGTLSLSTVNGFTPAVGENFLLATYASHTGAFGFVAPPQMPQGAAFVLDYTSDPTQLMMHVVAPVTQTWSASGATGTFGTAGNWTAAVTPTTTSSLVINNTGGTAKVITVAASTTVHRIVVSGTASTATLEVPAGIRLGVANQLVVGSNGILSGAGNVLGDVSLQGGVVASYGTVSGNVTAASAGSVIAPSATLGSTSHTTLTVGALSANGNMTMQLNLVTPDVSSGSDMIAVSGANGLTLNGGTVQVSNAATGAAGLGYYKILQYTGAIGGAGVASLTLPAGSGASVYTLDILHDPGFVDVHEGFLGDANDDGVVNGADFNLLMGDFGSGGATWTGGDFNGDGVVNFADFAILSNHLGESIGGGAAAVSGGGATGVPEPGSLFVVAGGMALLVGRRGRRLRRGGGRVGGC